MMRLIDADALKDGLIDYQQKHTDSLGDDYWIVENVLLRIEEIPTIEAVDVVRCKDCHYAKPYNKIWQLPKRDTLVCTHFANDEVDNNFFCGYAIKKMEEVKE